MEDKNRFKTLSSYFVFKNKLPQRNTKDITKGYKDQKHGYSNLKILEDDNI